MSRLPSGAHPPGMGLRDGVGPSCVGLPPVPRGAVSPWTTVLAFLSARFPSVPPDQWAQRMEAGDVRDECGQPVSPTQPYRGSQRLFYYRTPLAPEPVIPFEAWVIEQDGHLLMADKPHFLPVIPSGPHIHETLLTRLRHRTGLGELVPLHRLDADTAGLVLLSTCPSSRAAYQAMFREQRWHKRYRAVCQVPDPQRLPPLGVWQERASRLERCDRYFFRSREVEGVPNAVTRWRWLGWRAGRAAFELEPVTGRLHQLRVHLSAMGWPIVGDPWYPQVCDRADGDFSLPLQLLAVSLQGVDPISGRSREWHSQRQLMAWQATMQDHPPG